MEERDRPRSPLGVSPVPPLADGCIPGPSGLVSACPPSTLAPACGVHLPGNTGSSALPGGVPVFSGSVPSGSISTHSVFGPVDVGTTGSLPSSLPSAVGVSSLCGETESAGTPFGVSASGRTPGVGIGSTGTSVSASPTLGSGTGPAPLGSSSTLLASAGHTGPATAVASGPSMFPMASWPTAYPFMGFQGLSQGPRMPTPGPQGPEPSQAHFQGFGIPPFLQGSVPNYPYANPWLAFGQPWGLPQQAWQTSPLPSRAGSTAPASTSQPVSVSRPRVSPAAPSASSSEVLSEDEGPVLSIRAPSEDPLLLEHDSAAAPPTTVVAGSSAGPSHTPRPPSPSESVMEEQDTPSRFSFDKAANEVFRFLPEDVCPRLEAPARPRVDGFLDATSASDCPDNRCFLPMAPGVRQLIDLLGSTPASKPDPNGWMVPATIFSKGLDFRWSDYRFSKETFPLAVPQLDSDASRLNLKAPTTVKVPAKLFGRWELRARQLLGISSYTNAFAAAMLLAVKEAGLPDPHFQLLSEALNRSSRHALGLSFSLSAELLKLHREETLASNPLLSDNAKRLLSSAPIESTSMFGGLVGEVALSEQNDSLRDAALGASFKRPAPHPPKKRGGGGGGSPSPAKQARVASPLMAVQPPQAKGFQRGPAKGKSKKYFSSKKSSGPKHKP